MREILFRGKTLDKGEWVYGVPVIAKDNIADKDITVMVDNPNEIVPREGLPLFEQVDPETVGQYTGLKDKNGLTKIFEYDIIDANGRKAGNYYENSNLLKDGTCFLVAKMGTKEWSRSEQEAIKRGCKYAE